MNDTTNNQTTTEVTTRMEAGQKGIVTNLSINWEGMTREDLIALAQIQLVVKVQAGWRKGSIPEGDASINAVDYKVGTRAVRTKATAEDLLKALSPEDRKALLQKFLEQAQ